MKCYIFVSIFLLAFTFYTAEGVSDCGTKAMSGVPGAQTPTCDGNGDYAARQCWPSTGQCWCANKDGSYLTAPMNAAPTDGQPNCDSPCIQEARSMSGRLGGTTPTCDSNGDYAIVQYQASTGLYSCVAKDGTQLTAKGPNYPNCQSSCVQTGRAGSGRLGAMIPSCDAMGTYSPLQCFFSTGYCWCSDVNGNAVTPMQFGAPNCLLLRG